MKHRIKKKKWRQKLNYYTNKKNEKKNKNLCKHYPYLIPRNIFTDKIIWRHKAYDWTLAKIFEDGWWKAFGLQLCEELRTELLKYNYLKEFRITQIKEKYESLRCYYGPVPKDCEVDAIIDDYSALSENICLRCGKPDTPMLELGDWFMPICEDCYNKNQRRKKRDFGYEPTPYPFWKASEPRMPDERSYVITQREVLPLDVGNWNEYLILYPEFRTTDLMRIDIDAKITKYISTKHTRDLRSKAEQIRARWRTKHG